MSFTVRAYCQRSGDIRLLILPASAFFFFLIFAVYTGHEACILKQSKSHTPYHPSFQEITFLSFSDNNVVALPEPMNFPFLLITKLELDERLLPACTKCYSLGTFRMEIEMWRRTDSNFWETLKHHWKVSSYFTCDIFSEKVNFETTKESLGKEDL